jgi:thioredoxin reductase (NADPH)
MEFSFTDIGASKPDGEVISTKLLILGSGPAGLTAALYAARADLMPIVLTGMELGGQVSLTHIVENYPGFPDGIGGAEMVELFQKQAERFGAKIEFDTAIEVDLSQQPFVIKGYNAEYRADALIITTGATPKHLNIPGETELTGRGVSYCATCDGWFFKDKDVVVVGGGDSALEEGLFLTRYANSVTIVHRRNELRAGQILQNRATQNEKIKFVWDSVLDEIVGHESVDHVRLRNLKTGEVSEYKTDGVFVFIGHTPNTRLFDGQLEMDETGYLVADKNMHTNIEGVFAAGEVADPHFRQVITSSGMGAAAAIEAGHYLDSIEG